MPLGDAFQASTDKALEVLASRPIEPGPPAPKHSAWSVIPRALAAAGAEVGANVMDVANAYGQTAAATGAMANPMLPDDAATRKERFDAFDKIKTDGIDWRGTEGQQAYTYARDLRPDPQTAGTAENIVFGLTKGLTKAIGSAVVLGPAGGATVFGTSEGMTTAEDLAVQGVDQPTRTKVGAVVGAVSAAGMALPVAGQTLTQTAALVAVGGPGSFVAQQAASRAILENADYHDQAQQYDPLDPTGLALATLLPAGFAAYAKRGGFAKPGTPGEPPAPKVTPDEADAVMVHNLTAAADAHEATDPTPFVKAMEEASPPKQEAQPMSQPDQPAAKPQDTQAVDPRLEAIKTEQPDLTVKVSEDGTPVKLTDELEAAKKLAQEGTDDSLGINDAPLLKVAAECFLSLGATAG